MKNGERLFEKFGEVNEKYIHEVENYTSTNTEPNHLNENTEKNQSEKNGDFEREEKKPQGQI